MSHGLPLIMASLRSIPHHYDNQLLTALLRGNPIRVAPASIAFSTSLTTDVGRRRLRLPHALATSDGSILMTPFTTQIFRVSDPRLDRQVALRP